MNMNVWIVMIALAIIIITSLIDGLIKPIRFAPIITMVLAIVAGIFVMMNIGDKKTTEYYEGEGGAPVVVTKDVPEEPKEATTEAITEELDKALEECIVLTDEEIASLFSDGVIYAKFGEPRKFKDSSLLVRADERFAATGLSDAVTFNFFDTETDWVSNELRSNPIFASGVYNALNEIGIVGKSEWAKAYEENKDEWSHWISKEYTSEEIEAIKKGEGEVKMSDEYNGISSRLALLVKNSNDLGKQSLKDGWTIKKHWGLDAETETLFESTKLEKYDFYVLEYVFKDGTKKYIGINAVDGRAMLIEPATVKVGKVVKVTPKVTPKPTPIIPDDPVPDKDPDPTPTPTPGGGDPDGKDPQQGPDAKGNAPIGGVGEDGVDDPGPGELQPTEPPHANDGGNSGDNGGGTIVHEPAPTDAAPADPGEKAPNDGEVTPF